jgi:hypothetical protein
MEDDFSGCGIVLYSVFIGILLTLGGVWCYFHVVIK